MKPNKLYCFCLKIVSFLSLFFLTLAGWINPVHGGFVTKIAEAAERESRVVWWTSIPIDQSKLRADRFEKDHPFIKVDIFRSGSISLSTKIVTEARAGRHSWDVANYNGEFVIELQKRHLLAPYKSPETRMFDEDLKDKAGYWTGLAAQPIVLGYNTDQVKEKDVPRIYEALLDPKWKGKKISIDTQGYGLLKGLIATRGKKRALSYLRKLAAQSPLPMRGNTHRVQLVAAGAYPILIAFAHSIEKAKQIGAPVDWVPLEPVPVQLSVIMLASHAPHPNSAKLLIDFLLSRETQTMMRDMHRIPLRRDVDPNPPRLFKGYKRIVLQPKSYTNMPETIKLYQEIFDVR